MDASQVLVAILAVALAVLLVLSIILVSILLKIAFQIKRITATAEKAADKFDNIATVMEKAAAPAVFTKVARELIKRFISKRKGRD